MELPMGRILIFALLAGLGYLLFKGLTRSKPPEVGRQAPPPVVDDMVACARCGVNLPKGEAMAAGGGFICREGERCQNIR
jgi:uncharacterized protein